MRFKVYICTPLIRTFNTFNISTADDAMPECLLRRVRFLLLEKLRLVLFCLRHGEGAALVGI